MILVEMCKMLNIPKTLVVIQTCLNRTELKLKYPTVEQENDVTEDVESHEISSFERENEVTEDIESNSVEQEMIELMILKVKLKLIMFKLIILRIPERIDLS